MTEKISPYIRFARTYCIKKNLFTVDPITKKKDFKGEDVWEGIIAMYDYQMRNRGNKNGLNPV